MFLTIAYELVRDELAVQLMPEPKAPRNYSNPAKIAEYIERRKEALTSMYEEHPTFARIENMACTYYEDGKGVVTRIGLGTEEMGDLIRRAGHIAVKEPLTFTTAFVKQYVGFRPLPYSLRWMVISPGMRRHPLLPHNMYASAPTLFDPFTSLMGTDARPDLVTRYFDLKTTLGDVPLLGELDLTLAAAGRLLPEYNYKIDTVTRG